MKYFLCFVLVLILVNLCYSHDIDMDGREDSAVDVIEFRSAHSTTVDTTLDIAIVRPSLGTDWIMTSSMLTTCGYEFDTIPSTSGISAFSTYDVLILPNCWGYYETEMFVYESHAEDYKTFIRHGGYLIIEQTNPYMDYDVEEVTPALVPCAFLMQNRYPIGDSRDETNIVATDHPIFDGTTGADYCMAADSDVHSPTSWEVLARNIPSGNPSILVTKYSSGYVLRHSMIPTRLSTTAYINIVEWDGSGTSATCMEDIEYTTPGVWPQFHFDAQNRGLSPYTCDCDSTDVAVQWVFETGGAVLSSPSLAEGCIVFVGSNDSCLYALDAASGDMLWRYRTGGSIGYSSPALSPDTLVYIGAADGYIYAVTFSGALSWRYRLRFDTGGIKGSPTIDYSIGKVYICSDHTSSPWAGWLTCFNLDGAFNWEAYPPWSGSWIMSTPAIDDESYIFTTDWANSPGGLTCWNTSGADLWCWASPTVSGEMDILSSPSIDNSRDRIYFGGNKSPLNPTATKVFGVDYTYSSASLAWEYNVSENIQYSTAAIGRDGAVYIGVNSHNVHAFEPDGSVRWIFPTGGVVRSSPVVDSNDVVYVGSADGYVYAINPDGTLKWRVETGGAVYSSPAISPDGTIFIGSNDGKLYAIGCHPPGWCHAAPIATIIEPLPNTITACDDQQISIRITCPVDIDAPTIILGVGSEMYNYPDHLTFIEDVLVFTPSTPWSNGEVVSVALLQANNIHGDPLDSELTWTFSVDLEPPVYADETPPDGAVLGGLPEEITIELMDEISGLDESSVQLKVKDEVYTLDSPALYLDEGILHFNTDSAALTAGRRDSIEIVLMSASDTPDYCAPNGITPFTWRFYIESLQSWLTDTIGAPGDTLLIPVHIEDASALGINSFVLELAYYSDIMEIIGTETGGTASESWGALSFSTPEPGRSIIEGSGSTSLDSNPILCYIICAILPSATQGGYTPMDYHYLELDAGRISCSTEGAFLLVDFLPISWLAEITIIGNTANEEITLTFGASGSGSNGYDPGLDINALPPVEDFNAYFPIADPLTPYVERLSRDIRNNLNYPVCWLVHTEGEAGTLFWDPGYLPSGLFFINGYIDMYQNNFYAFDADEVIEICFERLTPVIGSVELTYGWNLISLCVIPMFESLERVFPTVVSTPYWYDPVLRNYVTVTGFQPGCGYWVYSDRDTAYNVGGIPVEQYFSLIQRGWNLIGSVDSVVYISSEPGRIIPPLFYWDLTAYVSSDSIAPGLGYWVLASAEVCTLEASTDLETAYFHKALYDLNYFDLICEYGDYPPAPPAYYRPGESILPIDYLFEAYPNPFNASSKIVFSLPVEGYVRLDIFNLKGEKVKNLIDSYYAQGVHSTVWFGLDSRGETLPSGVYFARLEAGNQKINKKLVLLK
ncbi:PQQ-binding-like beta-propeller repeat protein [bacterium]|nr:PQQ-binding-like beta-propeller repeat protein [bacterium]